MWIQSVNKLIHMSRFARIEGQYKRTGIMASKIVKAN